jgi:putative DNA primase/helicase
VTPEALASALRGHRTGATWMARCPVHDDRSPSLSISAGRDGKLLVCCHAGCEQRDLIAVLQQRGLWQKTERTSLIARNHRHQFLNEVADAQKRFDAAMMLWQASRAVKATPVESYLLSRGLAVPGLRPCASIPL